MEWNAHELNTGFEWQPTRGPYRRITQQQAESYNERGFFLFEDAFDADTVAEIVAEIDPFEAQAEAFLRTREDGKLFISRADEITFAPLLVSRSERLRAFCSGEVFRDLVHDLVGPDVRLYWDQSVYKKPGTRDPFPWHQDNGYTYLEPQQYLTCWVALTDTDESNGCPWVLPEIHHRGTLEHRMSDLGWVCADDPPGAVPLPVRAGSIAVFSSLTPHATGPNTSDSIRKSYIVQFAPDGAAIITRDEGGSLVETPAADAGHQFEILQGGRSPDAATLGNAT